MPNPNNIPDNVWAIMCRTGCSRESAERTLKAEQTLKVLTQTQYKEEYQEEAEETEPDNHKRIASLLDEIETDYAEQKIAENNLDEHYESILEKKQEDLDKKLALTEKFLGYLVTQSQQLESQSEDYREAIQAFNDATKNFLELAKQASDAVEKYNLLVRDFQRDYANKVHDLNMRLNH
jgi:hypothetical protein